MADCDEKNTTKSHCHLPAERQRREKKRMKALENLLLVRFYYTITREAVNMHRAKATRVTEGPKTREKDGTSIIENYGC